MIPDELRTILLSPIRPSRVGKDGKGFSHVEAYEIRAHLIRLFDFDGWDARITDLALIHETENAEHKWTVCWRARCELTVRWPTRAMHETPRSVFAEWATGEAKNQPSRGDANDLAIKTAESQALKRCAMNLGDQYGLSLYRRGSTDALVGKTWHSAAKASANPPAVDEHVTETPPESEQVPAREDTHSQSAVPQPEQAAALDEVDGRALRVQDLTAQLLQAKGRAAVGGIAAQIGKEKLGTALTYDADNNALTLNALLDSALKRVTRSSAA